MLSRLLLLPLGVLTLGCERPDPSEPAPTAPAPAPEAPSVTVVHAEDVIWEALNPARGDKSPQAGTLWGDRKASGGPTAFLARFVDGFSSPPHIHNVTYRGVVLSGEVHNAPEEAEPLWMPAGSYWTQPHGGAHITAARGVSVALIEIDDGPYLVKPPEEAYENDAPVLNVPAAEVAWRQDGALERALLWGDASASHGALLRLPAGQETSLKSQGPLRAVVITGSLSLAGEAKPLAPGGHLFADGEQDHTWGCASEAPCVVYARSEGEAGLTGAG